MRLEIFGERVLAWIGPLPVTETMATSAATSGLLLAGGAALGWAVRRRPGGRAASAARLTYRFLHELATEAAGRPSPALEVFAGTLFLFIAGAAIVGQLPAIAAPTASLPAAGALAALVFVAVPLAGIRAQGPIGYLRHYFRPSPLLFPLHLVSELSRTVALTLRLFGNMMSGHVVVALLVALAGLFVPVPLMALDLLIGFLQAYIFSILACVYVGAAIRVGEEGRP
jgi:F-type H+-transporting ATPase subunit a